MDCMFRRWVRLPTVLALLKPKRGGVVSIRLFTEDDITKAHYPWLEKKITFSLNGYACGPYDKGDTDFANLAENFVAKTITIDKAYCTDTMNAYLIEIKENK